MDSVAPGFIAAGGYHAAAADTPDDEGFAFEAAVPQAFDGDEEGIEIQMEYCPVVHSPNLRQIFDCNTVKYLT
jgi:hypothetical protein